MSTKELIQEISALPIEQRTAILDSIFRTLTPANPDMDQKWIDVARARQSQLDSGEVPLIPGEKVFERVLKRLS